MSIAILIRPALFDIVSLLVFMLSSVASSPPTRQPMIIYIIMFFYESYLKSS